jgi:hypothetical protein
MMLLKVLLFVNIPSTLISALPSPQPVVARAFQSLSSEERMAASMADGDRTKSRNAISRRLLLGSERERNDARMRTATQCVFVNGHKMRTKCLRLVDEEGEGTLWAGRKERLNCYSGRKGKRMKREEINQVETSMLPGLFRCVPRRLRNAALCQACNTTNSLLFAEQYRRNEMSG